MAKIYTKTGDLGKTRLVGGAQVSKSHLRLESYGTVDELNSSLGLALVTLHGLNTLTSLSQELENIQNQLFTIGSHLACENEETRQHLPPAQQKWIEALENSIDQMTAELPELKNFILPGGSLAAAYLHLARTICRRAERETFRLIESLSGAPEAEKEVLSLSLRFLNRLSDYLFVAARFSNLKQGKADQLWKK